MRCASRARGCASPAHCYASSRGARAISARRPRCPESTCVSVSHFSADTTNSKSSFFDERLRIVFTRRPLEASGLEDRREDLLYREHHVVELRVSDDVVERSPRRDEREERPHVEHHVVEVLRDVAREHGALLADGGEDALRSGRTVPARPLSAPTTWRRCSSRTPTSPLSRASRAPPRRASVRSSQASTCMA